MDCTHPISLYRHAIDPLIVFGWPNLLSSILGDDSGGAVASPCVLSGGEVGRGSGPGLIGAHHHRHAQGLVHVATHNSKSIYTEGLLGIRIGRLALRHWLKKKERERQQEDLLLEVA